MVHAGDGAGSAEAPAEPGNPRLARAQSRIGSRLRGKWHLDACSHALASAILFGASSARAESPSKVECVVANEAGQTLVQSGKRLEAERTLATCMAPSCPIPVRVDCAQRLREIDRVIASIAFELKDSAGHGIREARVTIDGQPVPDALGGKPLRLDAGLHRFLFEAEGLSPTEETFTLREGEKNRNETIVFASAPDTLPAAPPVGEHRSKQSLSLPSGTVATLAYIAAGAGIAGLAIGIGTGIAATSKHAKLEQECPGPEHACTSPPAAQEDIDAFNTARDWSTAGYVFAVAGLAGGVILWLAAPKAATSNSTAGFRIGPHTVGFSARF
jgi:hypothetical protein